MRKLLAGEACVGGIGVTIMVKQPRCREYTSWLRFGTIRGQVPIVRMSLTRAAVTEIQREEAAGHIRVEIINSLGFVVQHNQSESSPC